MKMLSERLPAGLVAHLVDVRRELHRHPELSNHEVETTARLGRELAAAGIRDVRPLGPTGLVVDLPGSRPDPIVVVRGDIDALPIEEQSGVPFRSAVPNVMHACGHDVHSAMTLGVALSVHARREPLPGTLRVIFQPAEEAEPLGGRAVVAGGHLDGVAAAVALHVDPDREVGRIGLRRGPAMASADEFTITVRGRSSHAGWPNAGADAIAAAATVVSAVHQLVARRVDPRTPATINIGRIEGGGAANIVADEVRMQGTMRTLDEPTRTLVARLLGEVVDHACASHGVTGQLELVTGEPVLRNDPVVIDAFDAAAREAIGADSVDWLDQPTMNSEDFAFYTERVPAAMAWIGVRNAEQGFVHSLHHPRFGVDERVIGIGVPLLLATAERLLGVSSI
jgi:amidohydrolase